MKKFILGVLVFNFFAVSYAQNDSQNVLSNRAGEIKKMQVDLNDKLKKLNEYQFQMKKIDQLFASKKITLDEAIKQSNDVIKKINALNVGEVK